MHVDEEASMRWQALDGGLAVPAGGPPPPRVHPVQGDHR